MVNKMADDLTIHSGYFKKLVKLNPEFISDLSKRGWTIHKKLGNGLFSSVFEVTKKNLNGALILRTNWSGAYCIEKIIKLIKNMSHIFPKVYDVFYTDIPYSVEKGYDKNSFKYRAIYIVEKMDCTYAQHIQYFKEHCPSKLDEFKRHVTNVVYDYCLELSESRLAHYDISKKNVAIKFIDPNKDKCCFDNIKIKLIDIDSIHKSNHKDLILYTELECKLIRDVHQHIMWICIVTFLIILLIFILAFGNSKDYDI